MTQASNGEALLAKLDALGLEGLAFWDSRFE